MKQTRRRSRRQSAPPRNNSQTIPLLMGGAAVLVTLVTAFLFLRATSESKKQEELRVERAEAAAASTPRVIEEPEPESSSAEPESSAGPKEVAMKDVFDPAKIKQSRVRLKPQELRFPDSVAPERRERIQALITAATDLNSTTEANESQANLRNLGIDAIPAILTKWVQLDMSETDEVIQANILVGIAIEVAGLQDRDFYRFQVQGAAPEDDEFREAVRKRWFLWWGKNREELFPDQTSWEK